MLAAMQDSSSKVLLGQGYLFDSALSSLSFCQSLPESSDLNIDRAKVIANIISKELYFSIFIRVMNAKSGKILPMEPLKTILFS